LGYIGMTLVSAVVIERMDVTLLADRTNGRRAYAAVLRLSSAPNVFWLNGAS